MQWIKKGLIYKPDVKIGWAANSALTPTPIVINDIIRIYASFRDNAGVGRIGFVDVVADNPSHIIRVSAEPVLDVGMKGCFDDNGVILGDVISYNNSLYMYYVGFQLVDKVKFLAFTGLAISVDGGYTFKRKMNSPILDRSDEGLYIRTIHSVMIEDGIWKAWCGMGSGWEAIGGTPYPQYNIKYLESSDGINFAREGKLCINPIGNEYRIGRPRVYKNGNLYQMYFTKGSTDKSYLPGYAESLDGVNWTRKDDMVGIGLSHEGWDSQTLCYPSIVKHKDRTYMFYNGNNMGIDGVGYAELC